MNARKSARHIQHAFETTVFNRARDFYLYARDGTRFIDLDMAEGRAVLGYKASGIGARIKQNLDKGIFHDIPTMWQYRFEKIISVMFPEYRYAGMYTRIEQTHKDTMPSYTAAKMWKPFANTYSDEMLHLLKPICIALPLAWDPPLYALLLPSQLEKQQNYAPHMSIEDELSCTHTMLSSTTVSPVLYSAFCAALALLRSCAHGQEKVQSEGTPSYRNRAFPAEHKKKANIYAITHVQGELKGIYAKPTVLNIPSGWTQRGIYIVTTATSDEAYQRMREILWRWGFCMRQTPRRLITLPYFFTKRELHNWNAAMEEIA